MSDLPEGWGNRHNQMSEHDMKLGGAAATKFTGAKSAYEASANDGHSIEYKNSDAVREFYLKSFKGDNDAASNNALNSNNVPDFWGERQQLRELEAKQMGVYSNKSTGMATSVPSTQSSTDDAPPIANSSASPEVALVQIATHTLETMTKALKGRKDVKIPMNERAEFAKALKGAMDALADLS